MVLLEFYIQYRTNNLMYYSFTQKSLTSYFCASEPATISQISRVILACRALLSNKDKSESISLALSVALSIAIRLAACSQVADSTIAPYIIISTYFGTR